MAKLTKEQLFTLLLDQLKQHGVSKYAAAKKVGINENKVANIRRGLSSVDEGAIKSLVGLYPVLMPTAAKHGIQVDARELEIQQILQNTLERNNKLEQDLEQLKNLIKHYESIQALNNKQKEELNKLINMIKNQTNG